MPRRERPLLAGIVQPSVNTQCKLLLCVFMGYSSALKCGLYGSIKVMGTIEMRYVNAVLTERRREHSEGLSDDFWRVFLDIVTPQAESPSILYSGGWQVWSCKSRCQVVFIKLKLNFEK